MELDTRAVRSRWRWIAAVVVVMAASCGGERMSLRFASLIPGEAEAPYDPGVDWYTLDTGLNVALVADPDANLVSVDMRYFVGHTDDPPDRRGLAHLVEHLMFEQRLSATGPTLGDRVGVAALFHNATTSLDATHYVAIGPPAKLGELLAVEAARLSMGCAGIDQATFERERAVVIQEHAERDRGGLRTQIDAAVFGASHPYSVAATPETVAAITLDDVCRFVAAHYGPARAVLVVGGAIDASAIRREVAARFGKLRRAVGTTLPMIPPVERSLAPIELRAAAERALALVVFPAPAWGSEDALYEDMAAIAVASRLREQVQRSEWMRHVETGLLGGERRQARFFAIEVGEPARLDDARAAIFEALEEIALRGMSESAVRQLGNRRAARLVTGFEAFADRGAWCADYLQFAHHRELHARELVALQVLDVARVRAAAATWTPESARVIRVMPSGEAGDTVQQWLASPRGASDARVWQVEVDPAEADRPLSIPPRQPASLQGARAPQGLIDRTLSNGLRILLAPGFRQPVLDARLVFPVGSASAGGRGELPVVAAELLEHNLQRDYTPKEAWTLGWVLGLGASLSRAVSEDHTTFSIRSTSLQAGWHVWRLQWLVQNGIYREKDLDTARAARARAEEREADQAIERRWRDALDAAVFGPDHPYLRRTRPAHALDGIDVDALKAFRDARYRASGAALIVVGKFDPVKVEREIRELFAPWPADPPPPAAPVPPMRPTPGPAWLAHTDPKATQVRMTFAFPSASPRAAQAARRVLAELVERRLARIRDQLGASYGVSARYKPSAAGDVLLIDGKVSAAQAGEALRVVLAAFAGLRDGDAALAADFVRARRAVLTRTLVTPTDSEQVADLLEAAAVGGAVPGVADRSAAVARLVLSDVRAVIAQDLNPAATIGLLSGRAEDVRAAYAAGGVAEVRSVDAPPP